MASQTLTLGQRTSGAPLGFGASDPLNRPGNGEGSDYWNARQANGTLSGVMHGGGSAFGQLLDRSFGAEAEENRRHGMSLDFLRNDYEANNREMASQESRLAGLFETERGQSNARGLGGALSGLNQSLGGRGIDPSSGAAQGALAALGGSYQNAMSQGRRDIALGAYDRASARRSAQSAYAQTLASLMNESPSMLGIDALTNVAEMDTARYGADQARAGAERGAKAQESAGRMSGIGSIIGSVIGLI